MWTLAQANAALFEVQGMLREAKALLARHQAEPTAESEEALLVCLEGFEARSIQVKRIEPGLLDFPAMLGNREVLLCWMEGEKEIGHYHDSEGGFAGRKPLPQIQL
ncbi:MAG: DUF2203 domain-containing protein [Thermoplasmatota archaeon]